MTTNNNHAPPLFFDLMHHIDHLILSLFFAESERSAITPSWTSEILRDFTALGGTAFLTMLTGFVVIYLLTKKQTLPAARILITILSGTILSNILKALFARPRPEDLAFDSFVVTASFPSGHTLISSIVYVTLGLFIARFEPFRSTKIFIWFCAALFPLLVGISRVYLGVHWPTDVIAGWLIGILWALLAWYVGARICQRRYDALKEEHTITATLENKTLENKE